MRTALSKLSGWDRRRVAVERYRSNIWGRRNMQYEGPMFSLRDDDVYVMGFKMFNPFRYVDDERFATNNNALVKKYKRVTCTAKKEWGTTTHEFLYNVANENYYELKKRYDSDGCLIRKAR